jgi:excisionase family DNA binding protein
VPDLREVSLDALVRLIVRGALRDELREQLAPIVERLDAIAAAAPRAMLDVDQAAERLGLSAATVRRKLKSGELPGVRLGRSWRVDLAAIGRRTRPEEIAELATRARRA